MCVQSLPLSSHRGVRGVCLRGLPTRPSPCSSEGSWHSWVSLSLDLHQPARPFRNCSLSQNRAAEPTSPSREGKRKTYDLSS